MPPILSLPVENILLIFQGCESFSQLASLFSTCRLFYKVWQSQSAFIIWHIGRSHIIAFDEALMAVRATEIVKDALQWGQLPPDPFPIEKLTGNAQRPSIEELKLILDFQHLVHCIRRNHLKEERECFDHYPNFWQYWDERFYSSVYRVFLAGAVLYRVYHEPIFLAADNGPSNFLKGWRSELEEDFDPAFGGANEKDKLVLTASNGVLNPLQRRRAELNDFDVVADDAFEWCEATFTASDVEYLQRFPIYNFEAYMEHGPVFKPLADFFVNLSKNRASQDGPRTPWSMFQTLPRDCSPSSRIVPEVSARILHCETMQFMFVCSELLGVGKCSALFVNGNGSEYYGRDGVSPPPEIHGQTRKISIVLLGRFCLEEITTPALVEDTTFLIANPVIRSHREAEEGAAKSNFRHMERLLMVNYMESKQPNYYNRVYPAPPPPLQFVQHILQNYLGLQIGEKAFEVYIDQPHGNFCEYSRGIFAEYDWDETGLTSGYNN